MSTSAAVDPSAVHLASTRVGSGPQPVVFLHGLFGRGRNFTSIARQLGEEHTSLLVDLPDEYLLWFYKKGQFPPGELGRLMQLTLELKIDGLDGLIKPLKR